MTSSTDPFSASIIPFEVPEQVRAFAEKGVSQARDSYAKFKDAAETHNGTIEAVFTSASKGASEYNGKLIEFFKANTSSSLDFAQELLGVKTPAAALELWTSHAKKQYETFTAQANTDTGPYVALVGAHHLFVGGDFTEVGPVGALRPQGGFAAFDQIEQPGPVPPTKPPTSTTSTTSKPTTTSTRA